MKRASRYYDAPAFVVSPVEQAPCWMVTSLRIAVRYRDRVPTIAELRHDMGMSRATAYRWRRAFKDVLGVEE